MMIHFVKGFGKIYRTSVNYTSVFNITGWTVVQTMC